MTISIITRTCSRTRKPGKEIWFRIHVGHKIAYYFACCLGFNKCLFVSSMKYPNKQHCYEDVRVLGICTQNNWNILFSSILHEMLMMIKPEKQKMFMHTWIRTQEIFFIFDALYFANRLKIFKPTVKVIFLLQKNNIWFSSKFVIYFNFYLLIHSFKIYLKKHYESCELWNKINIRLSFFEKIFKIRCLSMIMY